MVDHVKKQFDSLSNQKYIWGSLTWNAADYSKKKYECDQINA